MGITITNRTRVSEEDVRDGYGRWGVTADPVNDVYGWQCPSFGDGGSSPDKEGTWEYLATAWFDPDHSGEDGPDDLLYKDKDGQWWYAEVHS